MTDKNHFEIARKLQGFSKSNLHGALSDVLVDRIEENRTCPKESLIDSEIFGFEVPLVTGQVMDCSTWFYSVYSPFRPNNYSLVMGYCVFLVLFLAKSILI